MANILAVVAFVVGVVTTASGLVVWTAVPFDTTTGAEVARRPTRVVREGRSYFNPSGTRLIAVANQAGLSVVDMPAGRLLWERDDRAGSGPAVHPTRPLLAVRDVRGWGPTRVLYLNLDTGEPVAMPDPGFESVESLAFSPDGPTCAVGGTGRRFAVFDVDV